MPYSELCQKSFDQLLIFDSCNSFIGITSFTVGPELSVQILTLITIAFSIFIWFNIYRRAGIFQYMKVLWPAVIFWVIFGTLDIFITARGTFGAPENEGNPAARFFIEQYGFFGTSVASFLWIGLWVGIIGVILYLFNKFWKDYDKIAIIFALIIFYNLAIYHLWGFSTWITWMEPVKIFLQSNFVQPDFSNGFWSGVVPKIGGLVPGIVLTLIHLFFWYLVSRAKLITNKSKSK